MGKNVESWENGGKQGHRKKFIINIIKIIHMFNPVFKYIINKIKLKKVERKKIN